MGALPALWGVCTSIIIDLPLRKSSLVFILLFFAWYHYIAAFTSYIIPIIFPSNLGISYTYTIDSLHRVIDNISKPCCLEDCKGKEFLMQSSRCEFKLTLIQWIHGFLFWTSIESFFPSTKLHTDISWRGNRQFLGCLQLQKLHMIYLTVLVTCTHNVFFLTWPHIFFTSFLFASTVLT